MEEFSIYDSSVAQFRERLGSPRPLLLNWDMFAMAFRKQCHNAADLHRLAELAKTHRWDFRMDVVDLKPDTVIVVTDPSIKIVFASENMVGMTGYEASELIGKSPKVLQGAPPPPAQAALIREAINKRMPFEATVVNFRKDGTPYDCHLQSFPIFDLKGNLSHFIAFENAA